LDPDINFSKSPRGRAGVKLSRRRGAARRKKATEAARAAAAASVDLVLEDVSINSESTASMALPDNMIEWILGFMQLQRIVSGLHCFNSCLKGQVQLSGTQNPALTHNMNFVGV